MRTLGGAFGASIAAECLARGGSLDGDFALAFTVCAAARALCVVAVLAIPGKPWRVADLERSLTRHGLDYVDLYLVHWPAPLAFSARPTLPSLWYACAVSMWR